MILKEDVVFPARISKCSVVSASLVGVNAMGMFRVASGGSVTFFKNGQENGPMGDGRLTFSCIGSSAIFLVVNILMVCLCVGGTSDVLCSDQFCCGCSYRDQTKVEVLRF